MTLNYLFPNLHAAGFRETSRRTPAYNCIAWAAGEDHRWWDPFPGYYWPEGMERNGSVGSLISVFEAQGYTHCTSLDLEHEHEKIAIYAIRTNYTHVARQLPSGAWTSKIGALEDIEHRSADGLHGAEYGSVVYVMKRRLAIGSAASQ